MKKILLVCVKFFFAQIKVICFVLLETKVMMIDDKTKCPQISLWASDTQTFPNLKIWRINNVECNISNDVCRLSDVACHKSIVVCLTAEYLKVKGRLANGWTFEYLLFLLQYRTSYVQRMNIGCRMLFVHNCALHCRISRVIYTVDEIKISMVDEATNMSSTI